jgi:hypothetical protein
MGKFPTILLVVLSLGLLGANIGLQRRYAGLVGDLEQVQNARGPHAGIELPAISGIRPTGEAVTVKFSEGSLLLLFSAGCGICAENWPRWKELIGGVKPGTQIVYGDVTNSVSENYLAKYAIPAELVLTKMSPETKWFYDLRATPQTIIFGPDGTIKKVWTGRMKSEDVKLAISMLSK